MSFDDYHLQVKSTLHLFALSTIFSPAKIGLSVKEKE
jgi:hypothetical protein